MGIKCIAGLACMQCIAHELAGTDADRAAIEVAGDRPAGLRHKKINFIRYGRL
nr:hypothetical protein [Candidatus Sigynarchaeota archaeon]